MKNYANQSFAARFQVMGDPCERAFETWANNVKRQYIRFGFNRPKLKRFKDVSAHLRFMPDYLCECDKEHRFVECKGTGGKVLKLKVASHSILEFWDRICSVDYFVWDSNKSRFFIMPYTYMNDLALMSPIKQFENDKNEYYEINLNSRLIHWTDLEVKENDS